MDNGKKIWNYLKEHKLVVLASILWLLMSCSMLLSYKNEWNIARQQPVPEYSEGESLTGQEILLESGGNIVQEFVVNQDEITGLSLFIDAEDKEIEGNLDVKLFDKEELTLLGEWKTDLSINQIKGYFDFGLEKKLTGIKGKILVVEISVEGANKKNPKLEIGTKKDDSQTYLYCNGQEIDGIIPYRLLNGNYDSLKYFAILLYIGMTLCIAGVTFLIIKRKKPEWIFAIVIFGLGIIYLYVLPPFCVPDEPAHFVTVYAKSSNLLGELAVDEKGFVLVDSQVLYPQDKIRPSKKLYKTFLDGTLCIGKEEKNVISTRTMLSANHWGYLPQIFGVTLGRIAGLNGVQILVMGRVFALLWYCFVMFWALRLIPFGKMTLFVIGMLPMTIQQVVSYSYDSVFFGAIFLLISYLLYLIYEKEKVGINDFVLLTIISITIATIKFIYLPIIGLAIFIPKEKFNGLAKKIKAAVLIISISVISILVTQLSFIQTTLVTEESGVTSGKISLASCIANPLSTIAVFYRTIERLLSEYLFQMIGSPLGWLEINIPSIIIIALILLLFLSVIQKDTEKINVSWKLRGFSICVFGGISLLIVAALYLDWTSLGSGVVEGVQGRYFAPMLPLIVLIFNNSNFVLKRSIDYYIMLFTVYLNCMVVFYVTLFALSC